jgi:hypothetical protein
MRTFRILVGVTFLFFCTTLMHAGHMGMQDPHICSNSVGAVPIFDNNFGFSADPITGTSTAPSGSPQNPDHLPLQYLCFTNLSGSAWNYITVTPTDTISASDVFCDSQPNSLGVAFSCTVNSDLTTGNLISIVFNASPGDTGIPYGTNLFIDLNPCTTTGENCVGNGDKGNNPWPKGFGFTALVPEPASLALLVTGLLVTFRKRLLNWRG